MSKEAEYKELFYLEAQENFEELNRLFTDLEKNHQNREAVDSIFRITHTLKGNAMGIGIDPIAKLSHVMEDVMGAVKNGTMVLDREVFDSLFKANDKLGGLIQALKTDEKVNFLGIMTKLTVILNKALEPKDGDSSKANSGSVETISDAEEAEVIEDDEDAGQAKITFTEVIQMPVKKMDELMNLVGQLIIEKDRLMNVCEAYNMGTMEFERLQRISSDLQYGIMNARMVQVGFLFNKFHRIVRDVANIEQKQVNLEIKGADVEIDRNILKIMSDSLIHLVRNAVSHGIEPGDLRKKRGKKATGTLTLNARYEKDNVVIEVIDDGNGINADAIRSKVIEKGMLSADRAKALSDEEIILYIFEPGFSNAEKITEISGRGVGMDVVKKATESIGGHLSIQTEVGLGSTISMMLPSSLALKGALLFEVAGHDYAIPLSYTEAVISLARADIHRVNDGLMTVYLEHTISVVFLKDILNARHLEQLANEGALHVSYKETSEEAILDVIVISYLGKLMGIVVDKLHQQKEILEKSLAKPIDNTRLISGTSILGNGKVCLVVDVVALTGFLYKTLTKQ